MSDDHKRLKHLDFLQLTITRMAANSFLLKAWAVTLVAALFALAIKGPRLTFVLISLLPVMAFWILDGYYLHQEKLYRALYDEVRVQSEDEIDFSMNTIGQATAANSWLRSIITRTLTIFYGSVLVVLTIVALIAR